jgi:hypothetical protein
MHRTITELDVTQPDCELAQELVPPPRWDEPRQILDRGKLCVGEGDRCHAADFHGEYSPDIRDLASLSKTLARNRKSCTDVAATKGCPLWLRARAACGATCARRSKQKWRQAMKQNDRAKGSERAVALMVERIKSTETYAQMARVGITEDRARELVARGVRKVAYGNAECSLSMDDLKTARLRTRLPPWDIGLLERKLFGSAETRWYEA